MIELGSHAGIGLKSNIRIAQRAVDSDKSDPNAPLIKRIRRRRAPQDKLQD